MLSSLGITEGSVFSSGLAVSVFLGEARQGGLLFVSSSFCKGRMNSLLSALSVEQGCRRARVKHGKCC